MRYILAGLLTGLLQVSASAETLTGSVSTAVRRPDMQVDLQAEMAQQMAYNRAGIIENPWPPYYPQTRVRIPQKCLSAIGIQWNWNTGRIIYVDPGSSVYGRIAAGDYVISIADVDIHTAKRQRLYLGPEGSYVPIVFRTEEGEFRLQVLRQPIACFTPYFQQTLAH